MGAPVKESIAIYEKCQNPTCDKIVRKMPGMMKRGNGKYCSTKCRHTVDRITPSEEVILWILANQEMKRKEMAKEMKVSPRHLTTVLNRLRDLGYNIRRFKIRRPSEPKSATNPVFTPDQMKFIKENLYSRTATKISEMLAVDRIQMRNMCARLKKQDRQAGMIIARKLIDDEIKVKEAKMVKVIKNRVGSATHNNRKPPTSPPKKQEKVFKTRQIDESKCTRITIGKTTINVKPGEDVEAARKRWEEILRIGKKKAG